MSPTSTIGLPVGRVDGPAKVTGRALYSADVPVPGTLWGAVLRSPYPHARILQVDASRALKFGGVSLVLSGQDLGEQLVGRSIADVPVLAYDRVRFIGEPVVAVVAEDRDTAEGALALVQVEYEELPAVFDPFEAMSPGAPILHPQFLEYRRGSWGPSADDVGAPDVPNLCAYELKTKGDVDLGFRESDLVLEHSYFAPGQHQGYLEPHTCVVSAEPGGTVRIWASNKQPFTLREYLARDLGLPPETIVVEPTYVGGDFGGKGDPTQVALAYFLSKAVGRPVKLIMEPAAEMIAANPRHPAWVTFRSGLKRDGTLVAREVSIVYSSGAYAGFRPMPGAVLAAPARVALGVYRIPHTRYECRIAYTNHVPGGHMRTPGGAQVAFACEVDIDRLAEAVGMDPLEFRLKNGVEEGDLAPLGQKWSAIRLKECLRTVKAASGWGQLSPRYVGRGVAAWQDGAGPGGSSAIVQVSSEGMASLITAVNDQGSGAHTILKQLAANELQLPLDQVNLVIVGTEAGVWDRGSSAASVTRTAGHAVVGAAREVRDKLAAVAAEYLGCPPEQVQLLDGAFHDPQRPGASITFGEVAAQACREGEPVSGFLRYDGREHASATSFAAQVAEVEVDPETGRVKVRRIVMASDVGTVLNPIGVTGQLEGAMVMGLGYGLMEEVKLADGRVEVSGFHEYKLPTIADIPSLDSRLVTDGEGPGPYGAKAAAELGHVAVPAAIANAIYNAVGVRLTELPLTAERVQRALRARAQ